LRTASEVSSDHWGGRGPSNWLPDSSRERIRDRADQDPGSDPVRLFPDTSSWVNPVKLLQEGGRLPDKDPCPETTKRRMEDSEDQEDGREPIKAALLPACCSDVPSAPSFFGADKSRSTK
ncbi:hypothetical protein Vafri_14150, partial [Volvox africanus]